MKVSNSIGEELLNSVLKLLVKKEENNLCWFIFKPVFLIFLSSSDLAQQV